MNGAQKTCLVVVYNHNFEKNIPVIRRMYSGRFSSVVQLMPFYQGKDPDVIRVFGNSFHFHSFIAQARTELLSRTCERYLFIGDDLVLNPIINESSLASTMLLEGKKCFYPGFQDVSKGDYYRGTLEAHSFQFPPPGLDGSILKRIPCYEEAFNILHGKGLMRETRLSRVKPFYPLFKHPLQQNLYYNYKHVIRGRAWHLRNSLKYKWRSRVASYPVVFGYSDIFSVPRCHLEEFLDYIEVFASTRMFVELAIPTSLALHDWEMVFESDLKLKPLNVWFPQDPQLFEEKERLIDEMGSRAGFSVSGLEHAFPPEYLYMHPVKLSKWKHE